MQQDNSHPTVSKLIGFIRFSNGIQKVYSTLSPVFMWPVSSKSAKIAITKKGFDLTCLSGEFSSFALCGVKPLAWLEDNGLAHLIDFKADFTSEVDTTTIILELDCSDEGAGDAKPVSQEEVIACITSEQMVNISLLGSNCFVVRNVNFSERSFALRGPSASRWLLSVIRKHEEEQKRTKPKKVKKNKVPKESAAYKILALVTLTNEEGIAEQDWVEVTEKEACVSIADLSHDRAVLVNNFLTLSCDGRAVRRFKIEGGDALAWVKKNCAVPYDVANAA